MLSYVKKKTFHLQNTQTILYKTKWARCTKLLAPTFRCNLSAFVSGPTELSRFSALLDGNFLRQYYGRLVCHIALKCFSLVFRCFLYLSIYFYLFIFQNGSWLTEVAIRDYVTVCPVVCILLSYICLCSVFSAIWHKHNSQ